ncbi:unnamed protein product, partial [Medioppia subpectinata]
MNIHLTRNFGYFDAMGLKGPKPVAIFGNLWDMMYTSKPDIEIQRYHKYGKIYGIFEGSRPIIQVGDPETIKQVLVEDFRLFNTKIRITNVGHPIIDRMLVSVRGEQWRRMRAAVQPAFTTARTRRHYPLVRQCVTEQL